MSMTSRAGRAGLLLALIGAPALGQKTYENKTYGFAFKPPSNWKAIPPKPGEDLIVVKYMSEDSVTARKINYSQNPEVEVMVFQRSSVTGKVSPEEAARQAALKKAGLVFDDAAAWLKKYYPTVAEPDVREINKITCAQYEFVTSQFGPYRFPVPELFAAYVFKGNGQDVVLVFHVMEERADKIARDFERSARTFEWIEKDAPDREGDEDLSVQERFLQEQIDRLPPGWKWRWSDQERYLMFYDSSERSDDAFVKQLGSHLEAMRDYYEEIYPPEKPIEAVSIARVCSNEDTYHGYGGSPGTGGYWSSRAKELVIYNNKASDRNATFLVISHEAFHQYIYYYYGELAPHSWYNEGHGDYFGGAELSRSGKKVMKIEPLNHTNYPRLSMARESIRTGTHVPLKEFMNWSQRQYYSGNGLAHYAQGWSVVWFLLRAGEQGVRLDPKWAAIRGDYLKNLVAARDEVRAAQGEDAPLDRFERQIQEKAYELTFEEWTDDDWKAFEEAWMKFFS